MNKTFFSIVVLATMGFIGYRYFNHTNCTSCSSHSHAHHADDHHSHESHHEHSVAASPIVNLETVADLDALLTNSKPAFVKIYLDGCPPCRQAALIYPDLATQYPHVAFYELNVANNDVITALLEKNIINSPINAAPTFLYIKDGKLVEMIRGFSSKENFKSQVNTLLAQ